MFTQEEREYLDKKIQEVMSAVNVSIIPEDIRKATQDDVDRVVIRQRMLIGFALVVFAAWSWLIYQVYSGNASSPYFMTLVASAITGLVLYMAFYFGKILSSELSQIPAESWTDWIKKYVTPTEAEKAAAAAKSYVEARNQFIAILQYLMYILLVFVVVSFGLVVQIMYQPLSYLPAQWNPANLKFNVEYVPPPAGVTSPKAKRQ